MGAVVTVSVVVNDGVNVIVAANIVEFVGVANGEYVTVESLVKVGRTIVPGAANVLVVFSKLLPPEGLHPTATKL